MVELVLGLAVVVLVLLAVASIGFACVLFFGHDQASEDQGQQQAYAEYRARQRRDGAA